ncbi:MAG: hypothetical protein J6K69_06275 [Candidatus Methanomethylophilaceae archaeon]|nr:hypothetical protein [Candidatus Methanomethylophilaceae archaeon]
MAILLLRYAEIGLKSAPVRKKFENQLKDNMLTMLMEDGVEALITKKGARYYVEATDPDAAVRSLRKVFGVASISVAETCSSKMEDICATAAEYSLSRLSEGQSFAVDARREGSQGYTSMDVGREAGSAIFIANEDKGVKVDLTNPEVKFFIEVRDNQAYIFQDYIRCHAGLPIGSQGRVLAYVDDDRGLVSAWMMMKRGCRVVVKGSGDVESLRQYDPLMKVTESDYPRNILGYVMGHDLDDLEGFDASAYEFPVFFPTVGMTDEQVSEYAEMIRNGL